MEELMYYVWQQRMFQRVVTLNDEPLEVINPGLRNRDAGPDFFNAQIRIDGLVWAGNVEMHVKASDWYRHHHDADQTYDSVILHVVLQADAVIHLHDGTPLRTVVMHIPPQVMQRYNELCQQSPHPSLAPLYAHQGINIMPGQTPFYTVISCVNRIGEIPPIVLHDWQTALVIQRMMKKVERIQSVLKGRSDSWSEVFYIILTRSLGTGTNSDACERLARSLPFSCLLHHRDNLLQLKALLLGQADLISALPDATDADRKLRQQLEQEYAFLRHKFGLTPIDRSAWRLGRVRPPAQPTHRLQVLAELISKRGDLFSAIREAPDLAAIQLALGMKGLGKATVNSLVINAAVPMLIAYAQWEGDEERTEKALELLSQLPSEDNRYVQQWVQAGIPIRSALDSQAMLHLYREYCEPHKCLQCRLGTWLVRQATQQKL